jgi:flavin reductase (DIM6/NTAB) family NADH-FMN oxidoreductase RutF/DNA-binding MarR family transcriptional regulator
VTAHLKVKKNSPAVDRAYRACLGQFATGVTVVTTQTAKEPIGVTANSFASLSLDPPLITWAIARTSRSFAAFQAADRFVINILAADQLAISQAFSSRTVDKFAGIPWRAGKSGPIIERAAATLECSVEARHEGGDHLLIIGRVLDFHKSDQSGLVFAQGRYSVSTDHPDIREDTAVASDLPEPPFIGLLLQAYQHMATLFGKYRQKAGLSLTQAKILFALYSIAQTGDELAQRLFLGQRECVDAVEGLASCGDVKSDARGVFHLTAQGEARWRALHATAEQFEKSQMKSFSSEEIMAVRSFLQRIAGSSAVL